MLQVIHQCKKIAYGWSRRDLGALLQNRQNILFWVATRRCSSIPALHSSFCKRAIISSCSCSFSCCCWYFAWEETTGALQNYSNPQAADCTVHAQVGTGSQGSLVLVI